MFIKFKITNRIINWSVNKLNGIAIKKEFLKSKILLQVSINIFTCCVEKKNKTIGQFSRT